MAEPATFVIPQRDDDLLEESMKIFYVSELIDNWSEIREAMKTFRRSISQGEFEQIQDSFEYFFPLVRNNDKVDMKLRIELFKLLLDGLENLMSMLQTHLSDLASDITLADELAQINARYSNCLLMHIYLLAGLTNQFENYVNKKLRAAAPAARGKRKAQSEASDDSVVGFWAVEDNRTKLTRVLYKLISMSVMLESGESTPSIKFLWTPNKIDGSLKMCILSTLCKFLENPETCKVSGRSIMLNVFNLLRYLSANWGMHKAIARSLMELAPKLDYFQTSLASTFPFVDTIFTVQTDAELEPLIHEMISYGSRLDTEHSNAKTESASRALSLFLVTIAEKSPRTVFKHLAVVIPFLHCDPPILRNAVLSVYTEVLLNCFDDEEMDEIKENQRNTLFQAMMDHIVDKSALVRTKVLHLWEKLAFEHAIPPVQMRVGLLVEARGRLKDDSVMVRKAAASLLIALIKFNRFGANLDFGHFYEQLTEAKVRHNLLCQENPTSSTYLFEDAYNAVGDERILLGEDRANEFEKESKKIESEMESLLDAILFVMEMEQSMNLALQCVRRAQVSEMQEMMRFVCECCKFRIRDSMIALKRVFNLIWRKDNAVVDAVVEVAYEALFSQNENKRIACQSTAQNLIEAMKHSNDEERISLEETITQMFIKKVVPQMIVDEFWKHSEDADLETRFSVIRLIVIVAKANKPLILPHTDRLCNLYQTKTEQIRIEVLRVLMALAAGWKQQQQQHKELIARRESVDKKSPFPLSSRDKFVRLMSTFIVHELNMQEAEQWFPHCRQAVNIIYGACSQPTKVIPDLFDNILEKINACLDIVLSPPENVFNQNDEVHKAKRVEFELMLNRLFYFVGEVVLKFLSYAETTFSVHYKKNLSHRTEQQSATPCAPSRRSNASVEKENEEALGQEITEDEKIQMILQRVLDKEAFAQHTIIGRTLPLLMIVLENRKMWSIVLTESALLCLAKLMLVNQRCCKIFLPAFFKFFDVAQVRLRNNMIIMMTDLCFRFPNVFNEFNNKFIIKIRDENSGVRYTCLLVLSHMLLNDQIKITADIADIAYCMMDEEPHIKTLAYGFFGELSKKHNVLYNHIPAIVAKLIADPNVEEEKLEEVLQHLMQYVEKEPQKEKLVDKLVERFEQITNFRCISGALKARKDKEEAKLQHKGNATPKKGRPPRNK